MAIPGPSCDRARRLRQNNKPATNSKTTTPAATPPPIAPALVDLCEAWTGAVVGEVVGESVIVAVGLPSMVELISPVRVPVGDMMLVVELEFKATCWASKYVLRKDANGRLKRAKV